MAASIAAVEADRLARDTERAWGDARLAAQTAHNDNVAALDNTANAIGQAQAAANLAHSDNTAALQAANDANTGSGEAARVQERLTAISNDITSRLLPPFSVHLSLWTPWEHLMYSTKRPPVRHFMESFSFHYPK
ncbi:MAG: hypothetical protein WDM86_15425 [Rhizomicrobium sp.]